MRNIPYTIKKIRLARHLRLTVHYDGRVVVTAPPGLSRGAIEAFVSEKKRWIFKQVDFFKKHMDEGAVRIFSKDDYKKHKDEACRLVAERMRHFNKLYGFSINTVAIRDQKTRWGSCSPKKNVYINYRVLFLPAPQRDYIIVHELCHLQELNHSQKFWRLVMRAIPDYAAVKNELRRQEKFFR